jgi:hypothetical protein
VISRHAVYYVLFCYYGGSSQMKEVSLTQGNGLKAAFAYAVQRSTLLGSAVH